MNIRSSDQRGRSSSHLAETEGGPFVAWRSEWRGYNRHLSFGLRRGWRMLVCEAHRPARLIAGLSCLKGGFLLVTGCSLGLLTSALGQASQPEVGREVSRIQRPTLFPMATGQGEEAALAKELPERKEYGQLRVLYDTRPLP